MADVIAPQFNFEFAVPSASVEADFAYLSRFVDPQILADLKNAKLSPADIEERINKSFCSIL